MPYKGLGLDLDLDLELDINMEPVWLASYRFSESSHLYKSAYTIYISINQSTSQYKIEIKIEMGPYPD